MTNLSILQNGCKNLKIPWNSKIAGQKHKAKLYENVRKSLAEIDKDEPEPFGPVSLLL